MLTPRLMMTAGILGFASCAAAQTALDTFGPGNTYEENMFLAVRGPFSSASPRFAQATMFTAQATGEVQEITTVLRHVAGQNDFAIQIRAGDANQVGAILGSWNVEASDTPPYIITIPTGPGTFLQAGTTYHIAAIGYGSSDGAWHQNNQNINSAGYSTSSNQGGTFFFVNGARIPATRISFESGTPCYANCDGSTVEPVLNVDDFTCFINEYAAAQSLPHEQQIASYPNCDGSTIAPVLNVDDFTCFINAFAQGCP